MKKMSLDNRIFWTVWIIVTIASAAYMDCVVYTRMSTSISCLGAFITATSITFTTIFIGALSVIGLLSIWEKENK